MEVRRVEVEVGEQTVEPEAEIAALRERTVALERENKILRDELAILKRGMFGRRSERIENGQLDLYQAASVELPAPPSQQVAATSRRA